LVQRNEFVVFGTLVLQGVISNYDTDLFTPLIKRAAELTGTSLTKELEKEAKAKSSASLRVIADHSADVVAEQECLEEKDRLPADFTVPGIGDIQVDDPPAHEFAGASVIGKPLVFLGCLGPLALLVYKFRTDGLGANPIEYITHETGVWTLRFLLITLSITPLRRLFKVFR
jgi:hypothetical protein